MMQKIRWFLLILIAALTLTLVFQNQAQVEIQLLFWNRSLPLSILLISTTTIGFLLGALLTASMLRKRGKKKQNSPKSPSTPIQTSNTTKSRALGSKKAANHPLETGSDD